jgi:hypothetical protein
MTSLARKLAVAAVLASSIPAAALAHDDCEHGGRDGDHRLAVFVPPVAPPPAYAPVNEFPVSAAAPHWREGARRERRIHELRAELRALDARRAEAYARFGGNPWRLRRFDRWYAFRRAEIERRLNELAYVAWR